MKITVNVKTNKKENKITLKDDKVYEVWLKTSPIKGAANGELKKILAEYFKVTPSSIEILHGQTSSHKLVQLP